MVGSDCQCWKSASYIAQFMHGYRFNKRIAQKLDEAPSQVVQPARTQAAALLCRRDFESWRNIDPANSKLRQLAAYRVVFGQPRQEELLNLLDQSELSATQLGDWAIDLSPPK